jgi:hypothetical protein
MKKCSYCGLENPDEATKCITCHTNLAAPTSDVPLPQSRSVTSLDEQRFWARMTFRQFAALFMRLQAVWLLWYAALDSIYLVGYIGPSYTGHVSLSPAGFRLILRMVLHIAAAVAVIRYADRILSWLVRDWIRNQPFNGAPQPTTTTSSGSARP